VKPFGDGENSQTPFFDDQSMDPMLFHRQANNIRMAELRGFGDVLLQITRLKTSVLLFGRGNIIPISEVFFKNKKAGNAVLA
jgi:hypothetical protein